MNTYRMSVKFEERKLYYDHSTKTEKLCSNNLFYSNTIKQMQFVTNYNVKCGLHAYCV